MSFHDHFSTQASSYARYRPDYPASWFGALAEAAPGRRLVWDCATGNGQAAVPMSRAFDTVVATDGSIEQLVRAARVSNLRYVLSTAERAPFASGSVDAVVVAQALHWFDVESFWGEVRRVLRPSGVVVAWTCRLIELATGLDDVRGMEIDRLLRWFFSEVVGPYWPPERRHVDEGYAGISFPFARIDLPELVVEKDVAFEELIGYVSSWSAVARYRAQRDGAESGRDPLDLLRPKLASAWGAPDRIRRIRWPVTMLSGRLL